MRLIILIFAFLCLLQRLLMGVEVTLAFNPSANSNSVYLYTVNYGPVSRGTNVDTFVYPKTNSILVPNPLVTTVSNLPPGITYFSAQARDTNFVWSFYSNEVSYTNRDFAPITLRLQVSAQGIQLEDIGQPGVVNILGIWTNHPLLFAAQMRQILRAKAVQLPPLP